MSDNKQTKPLEVENQGTEDKRSRKRITSNPFRPDYYWLEGRIWYILAKHQEQIIKEIVEVISEVDTDRTLA